jgi:DUF1707 SHOCT-like domain
VNRQLEQWSMQALTAATARSNLRASDEDRDRTARALRDHYAAGRIAHHELEERIDRAYAAQTRRELARLTADLPTDRVGRAARGLYWGQRTVLRYHTAAYVGINGAMIGVWEVTGQGAFWPAIVLAPTTAIFGMHAASSRWLRRRLNIRGRYPRDDR